MLTTMLTVIIVLAIIGVVLWLISRVPMPPIWRNVIYAAVAIMALIGLLQLLRGGALAL